MDQLLCNLEVLAEDEPSLQKHVTDGKEKAEAIQKWMASCRKIVVKHEILLEKVKKGEPVQVDGVYVGTLTRAQSC